MKSFIYLLYLLLFCQANLWAQAISNASFSSAEEQIVYNKQQHRPKYEHIQIQYNFNLSTEGNTTDFEALSILARQHFLDVVSVEVVAVDSRYELQVLTEGNLINHEKAQEIMMLSTLIVGRKSRQYWLKPH
jgi:hypothetical protein